MDSKKVKSTIGETPNMPPGFDVSESEGKLNSAKKRKRGSGREAAVVLPTEEDTIVNEKPKKQKKKKRDRDPGAAPVERIANPAYPSAPTTDGSLEAKVSRKENKKRLKTLETETLNLPVDRSRPKITPQQAADYLKENLITIKSPNTPIIPATSFDQLDISDKLRSVLSNFQKPTPIQACAWPALLAGHDVVGIAETGSGKTLAFGLPALAHLTSEVPKPKNAKQGKNISILVVAPTRELALQTHDTMEALGVRFGIKSVCVFGGVDKAPQKRLLASSDVKVVVGTPGRLLDLANEGACDLSGVSYLVLDEADRMLDKGFENDIRNIISQTGDGTDRQTLMFSATWPESVRKLASTFLRTPVRITVGSDDLTANSRVVQSLEVFEDPRSKDKRLHTLLKALNHSTNRKSTDETRILIFVLYKKEADRVLDTLKYIGFSAVAIHGDMGQHARLESLDAFKTGRTSLLVATDVAARGLDIPNVGAVINYSFPLTIEDYIHRIGRTGRGGKDGKSITFFTGDKHERSIAGELARVLRSGGFDKEAELLREKFPMTLKKKEHSAYGAFFRETSESDKQATKIKF